MSTTLKVMRPCLSYLKLMVRTHFCGPWFLQEYIKPLKHILNISEIYNIADLDVHAGRKGRPETLNVWLFSSLSVIAIALCEVFAVLVVPIMQRVFYQHIIQFLIALAIGSLLGKDRKYVVINLMLYSITFRP